MLVKSCPFPPFISPIQNDLKLIELISHGLEGKSQLANGAKTFEMCPNRRIMCMRVCNMPVPITMFIVPRSSKP